MKIKKKMTMSFQESHCSQNIASASMDIGHESSVSGQEYDHNPGPESTSPYYNPLPLVTDLMSLHSPLCSAPQQPIVTEALGYDRSINILLCWIF